jgi:type II secretory pathway predicted ATPase ExeA
MDRVLIDKDVYAGLARYGLTEPPFPSGTDPEVAWLGEAELQLLARLEAGVLENQGLLVLVGNVGTGKTMLANVLVLRLGTQVTTARVSYPNFELMEFLENVGAAWGLEASSAGREAFYASLPGVLDEASARGSRLLLVVDEAQSLRDELFAEISSLEEVRGSQDPTARVAILLVGQENLNAVLAGPENASLKKKIAVRCTTLPLAPSDVEDYVRHHLSRAGSTPALFTSEALRMIARGSHGIPRLVNTMADQALLLAARQGARRVGGDIVQEATGWRRADRQTLRHRRRRVVPVGRVAGLVTVVCVLAVSTWYVAMVPRREARIEPSASRLSTPPPRGTSSPGESLGTGGAADAAPQAPALMRTESADQNGVGVPRPEHPGVRPGPAAIELPRGPRPQGPIERPDASAAARPGPPAPWSLGAPAAKSPPPIPVPLPPAAPSIAPVPPRGGQGAAAGAPAAPPPRAPSGPTPGNPERARSAQSQADADVDPGAIIDWVLQEYPARRQ